MSIGLNKYKELINLSILGDYCRGNGEICHYNIGDVYVQQGYVGKFIGIVESGYFKYTTITTDGNEVVVGFAFEGEFVCDFNSSLRDLPSEVSIVAGSKCTICQISSKVAKKFIDTLPNSFHNNITNVLFREIYHRYLELYRKSPTERYLELLNYHPDIFNIVKIKEIASYLRVTPIYLSRIRKKLYQNKQI